VGLINLNPREGQRRKEMRAFYSTGYRGSILEIEHQDGSIEIYDSVAEDISAALNDRLDALNAAKGGIEWTEEPLSHGTRIEIDEYTE
jgi:hypothetical protein